jgi:hypothetical protein
MVNSFKCGRLLIKTFRQTTGQSQLNCAKRNTVECPLDRRSMIPDGNLDPQSEVLKIAKKKKKKKDAN